MISDDTLHRARIVEELERSFVVEAAAGTGKTHMTVDRLVAMVERGRARPEGLVALSFTRKAAGELSFRLRRRLALRANEVDGRSRSRLEDGLRRLDEAQISTLHGFCAELVRAHPVEARVDPEFRLLSRSQSSALFGSVFRTWFERELASDAPGARRMLALADLRPYDGQGPRARLEKAARELAALQAKGAIEAPLAGGAEWRSALRPLAQRAAVLGRKLAAHSPAMASKVASKRLGPLLDFGSSGVDLDSLSDEALEAELRQIVKFYDPPDTGRLDAQTSWVEFAKEAIAFRADANAVLDAARPSLGHELLPRLEAALDAYRARKATLGVLDHDDLLSRARDLMRRGQANTSRFDVVFVDEFQDTDPIQAEVVRALVAGRANDGSLFVVGDPKQSIYAFRGADVRAYQSFCDDMKNLGVEQLTLTRSFRAVGPLQAFINEAFAPAFEAEPGQPQYVPITGGPQCAGKDAPPPIVALNLPSYRVQGTGRYKEALDAYAGAGLARFIAWILEESGWHVRAGSGASRVPVKPEHIAVLARGIPDSSTREASLRVMVSEFENLGVPHAIVGRRFFDDKDEVLAIRTALTAVEWPHDRFRVYAALRSALFSFDDHLLARWLAIHGALRPLDAPPEDPELRGIQDALELLTELSRGRNDRPIGATIEALLRATRGVTGFAHERSGPESAARIRAVLGLADRHEAEEKGAFRTFIQRLEELGPSELAEVEMEADGVRILTAHNVKGLEFPIVVLADARWSMKYEHPREDLAAAITRAFLGADKGSEDRRRGEELRVAYVAATRARDCLVVCQDARPPRKGRVAQPAWFGPVDALIRHPSHRTRASAYWESDAPCWDDDPEARRSGVYSGGDWEVDWAPASLQFAGVREHPGILRHERALEDGPGSADAVHAYRRWLEERASTRRRSQVPSVVLLRASEAELPPSERVGRIRIEQTAIDEKRPRGKRFGFIVHEVLRHLWAEAPIEDALLRVGRQTGADEQELEAAKTAVERAWSHPLLERARASDARRAEVPVALTTDDGQLLDGVVDLMFREGDRWVVVDYKTQQELEPDRDRIMAQLAWYLWAVERATGARTEGVVLQV